MKHMIHLMAVMIVEKLAWVACIADAGKTAAVVVVAAGSFDSCVVVVAAADADTVAVVDTGIAVVVPDGLFAEQKVELPVEMAVCIVDAQAARYAEPGHGFRNRRKRVSEVIRLAERVALA